MSKIWVDGFMREMTPEEEAAWNQAAQEQPEQPEQPPTVEDRVQILEEAIELLISGATE